MSTGRAKSDAKKGLAPTPIRLTTSPPRKLASAIPTLNDASLMLTADSLKSLAYFCALSMASVFSGAIPPNAQNPIKKRLIHRRILLCTLKAMRVKKITCAERMILRAITHPLESVSFPPKRFPKIALKP